MGFVLAAQHNKVVAHRINTELAEFATSTCKQTISMKQIVLQIVLVRQLLFQQF